VALGRQTVIILQHYTLIARRFDRRGPQAVRSRVVFDFA
jgi:hypothetical protein